MRARLARLSLLGCVVVIGGAAVWVAARSGGSPAPLGEAARTTTVPIVRTTLVATQPESGRVAVAHSWTIGLVSGSTPDLVATASDAALAASDEVAGAQAALRGATRIRSLTLAGDRAEVASAAGARALAAARRHLDLDSAQQALTIAQARAAVTAARHALDSADRELADRQRSETSGGTIVTSIAASGTRIDRGGDLFALDGHPAVLLLGSTPAFRAMRQGDRGADVAQLQTNLIALGVVGQSSLRTDGVFDPATAAAVGRWQASRGVDATGIVRLGDVTFLPTAVEVAAARIAVGTAAALGTPVLDLSSVERIVTILLDPALVRVVDPGDALRFTLPGGAEATGHVETVAAVATPTTDGQSGGGSSGGGQGGGPLFITVTATADDPAQLDGLDGVPVTVDVTAATAQDVLAVPVNALAVLADGSFGVELATNGTSTYVRVQTGIYDRTLVEIRGDGLAPGGLVVVPAS
jgi:peptidoglycan hydrolase-like protein with peptidoglycan-binding domain